MHCVTMNAATGDAAMHSTSVQVSISAATMLMPMAKAKSIAHGSLVAGGGCRASRVAMATGTGSTAPDVTRRRRRRNLTLKTTGAKQLAVPAAALWRDTSQLPAGARI
jgi:hypothetical protein